ncbi:hypothetical protein A2V82_10055 [candidate division KSB1 bacterium RBG_16_48_16]|nr:MAG: hypothetical protein A2V82_10055 [candidate division KSB1 bacterium RBG_16_48_16]
MNLLGLCFLVCSSAFRLVGKLKLELQTNITYQKKCITFLDKSGKKPIKRGVFKIQRPPFSERPKFI